MNRVSMDSNAMQQRVAYQGPVDQPRDPGLLEIEKAIDDQHGQLAELLMRLTGFADRVLGSFPVGGNPEGPVPVPSGLIDEIQQKQAGINALIVLLDCQASRLDRIG